MSYRINGADEGDYTTIYATHPALPGTYICYAFQDGEVAKEPVVLWGVLCNGTPEPISMSGVWNSTPAQANMFVMFPDGRCARFDQSWESETAAADELRQYDRSE